MAEPATDDSSTFQMMHIMLGVCDLKNPLRRMDFPDGRFTRAFIRLWLSGNPNPNPYRTGTHV